MRLLIVEDEKRLREVLVKHLKNNNYSVDACATGEEAKEFLAMADYDVAILDVMLPGISGFDVLKWARGQKMEVPVLFLTARDSVDDKVRGLDLGADDYLTKPFAFEELLARLRMLTRKKAGSKTNIYTLEDLTVDCGRHIVERAGSPITLSRREFAILEYMIMNKDIVLTRSQIEEHIWDYDYEGSSNMIDVYIRYLRKKIDEPFSPKLIHTVRGRGYVLRVDPEQQK